MFLLNGDDLVFLQHLVSQNHINPRFAFSNIIKLEYLPGNSQ